MEIREITSKSILTPSGISDYAVNPYRGCVNNCAYCYARYIYLKAGDTRKPGSFVDIKVNAALLLQKELLKKKKKKGSVFFSTICDGWQPVEKKYNLSGQCLRLAVKSGLACTVLTKSSLVEKDFGTLLEGKASLGLSISTLSDSIARVLEPGATLPSGRLNTCALAVKKGISVFIFAGPILPVFCDTPFNIENIIRAASDIGVDKLMFDRLNLRSGVMEVMLDRVEAFYPELYPAYAALLGDRKKMRKYEDELRQLIISLLKKRKPGYKVEILF